MAELYVEKNLQQGKRGQRRATKRINILECHEGELWLNHAGWELRGSRG